MTIQQSDKNRRLPPNVEAEILRLCQGIQTSRTKYETLDVLRHVAEFAILDAQMSAIASPRPSSAATGETPRTDAAITVCRDSVFGNEYVPIAVARQLERELAVSEARVYDLIDAARTAPLSSSAETNGDALAAALEPFANYAMRTLEIEGDGKDNPDSKLVFTNLTYGHFRAAVNAMRGRPISARSVNGAVAEIAAERQRQVEKEGFDVAHDDAHGNGELAAAAACYAMHGVSYEGIEYVRGGAVWPWDAEWWKPRSHRENLIRAAALIVAEIERMDRHVAPVRSVDGRGDG